MTSLMASIGKGAASATAKNSAPEIGKVETMKFKDRDAIGNCVVPIMGL